MSVTAGGVTPSFYRQGQGTSLTVVAVSREDVPYAESIRLTLPTAFGLRARICEVAEVLSAVRPGHAIGSDRI